MSELPLEGVSADTFAPHEGTDFLVDTGNGDAVALRLAEVQRLTHQPHAPRPEPFSLLFLGPASPVLPQRIYPIAHPVLGLMELFIVPLGPEPGSGGMRYEAAFN